MPGRRGFTAGGIGLVLVSLLTCFGRTEEAPAWLKTSDTSWSTIKTEHYTLYYHKDFAADAQRAKTHLDSTIDALREEFSDYEPEKILKKVDCHVYLHPTPSPLAYDGQAACITWGLEEGRRHAELHFLTPAAYSPTSRDNLGELKKTDHHFFRYIVHEYSPVFLGTIIRSKSKGWEVNGQEAPNWFWQGYEEYLGMTLSSAHSRNVTFAKYLAIVQKDPDRVLLAHGYRDKTLRRIVVQGDYTDGFALLAFMHDQFGKRAVQRLLVSEQETFEEALRATFQMEPDEFYEKFQAWLEAWKPPLLPEESGKSGT